MSNLTLFNTETRCKEPLRTLRPGEVLLYTCGPTVYNFAHIGNFRTYVFEDLLRRTLKLFGYRVVQVMNLTDVDDKTIRGAVRDHCTLEEYVKPYIEAFFEDLKTLHIEPVEFYPAATEYIPQMIRLIQTLMDKGVAYTGSDGSVYFSIQQFPNYGRLSHLESRTLKEGASERVQSDEYDKDNASDFVLWKAYDPERDGLVYWESPFGKGRPGWHIECSCMAMAILGETVDIHVGGIDNMFPHHENEIAQSEAATGSRFVNHWMHSEHLLVEGRKMSKSLGNFYTLRDLLEKGYSGDEVRWALMSTHYRTQLNFSLQLLEGSRTNVQRLKDFIARVHSLPERDKAQVDCTPYCEEVLQKFQQALGDDLNISVALAALWEWVKDLNTLMDQGSVPRSERKLLLHTFMTLNRVLGLEGTGEEWEAVPPELLRLLEERTEARFKKDWKKADQLRDAIQAAGYFIEDSPEGPRLRKGCRC